MDEWNIYFDIFGDMTMDKWGERNGNNTQACRFGGYCIECPREKPQQQKTQVRI